MSKKLVLYLVVIFSLTACVKDKTVTSNCVSSTNGVPTATEMADLQAYLTSKNITNAIQDSRGFYYTINASGSGGAPNASSVVKVNYVGNLTNGTEFDKSTSPFTSSLSQLIKGWQYGLPYIQKGGSIKLYLPPTLGYGCNAIGNIPPGSILIFNIDLLDVF